VKMERVKEVGKKLKGKAGEGFLGMVEDLLGSIDAFDQVAGLVKTVVPMKAEITVKGKKSVEIRALIKDGELWVGFKRSTAFTPARKNGNDETSAPKKSC